MSSRRCTGAVSADAPFVLDDPPRLVVDLPGAVWDVSRGVIPVRESGVHRVRIRQNQPLPDPVTRVVFDLASADVPHEIVRGPQGLVVAVGRAGSAGHLPRMASAGGALATSSSPDAWSRPATSTAGRQLPPGLESLAELGRPAGCRAFSDHLAVKLVRKPEAGRHRAV